jgi:hypothetical protein
MLVVRLLEQAGLTVRNEHTDTGRILTITI